MNRKKLSDQLKQINSVKVESINNSNHILVATELADFTIKIDCENITGAHFISSPHNEECLQIYFSGGGGIIVTPNDFVFNVEQDEFVRVGNLPPMCSIREMVIGYENYKKNPNPSDNIDNNFELFYIQYYIFKSAINKGFKIPMIIDLYNIGNENGFIFDKACLELFKV